MTLSAPTKRYLYALGLVASAAIVISVSTALLSNVFSIENTEASPKINGDIHSQVIHQSIVEQLLQVEGAGTGYLPTTLRRADPSIDNAAITPLDTSPNDSPYVGNITSTSGARYQVEAELLTAGDEVIPVYIELTLIEEDEL